MNKEGLLIVLSGFSGSGKGTVVKKLLEDGSYALSVSATTRLPRPGEVDGESYFFTDKQKFIEMIKNDEFLEYAEYVENYYGTPKKYVMDKLSEGINVILEIEVQGALKVKKAFPDTILIFIVPPGVKELEQRLVGRHTEEASTVRSRMEQARVETESMNKYDYIVINDDINRCVSDIKNITEAVSLETARNKDMIVLFKQQFEQYLKGETL